jgi:hypothetical protein
MAELHGKYNFTPAQKRTIETCDKLFTRDIKSRMRLWQNPKMGLYENPRMRF